jgi:hypothetical protein
MAPHHEIARRCGLPDKLRTPSSIAESPFGRAAKDVADQTSWHSGPYRSAARRGSRTSRPVPRASNDHLLAQQPGWYGGTPLPGTGFLDSTPEGAALFDELVASTGQWLEQGVREGWCSPATTRPRGPRCT